MWWFIPLFSGVLTIVALFTAKPERKRVAVVYAVCVFSFALLQTYSSYQDQENKRAILRFAYKRLSDETYKFLHLIDAMIEDATTRWLPSNDDEFFSMRSAELICKRLNIEKPARVTPRRSWLQYLSNEAGRYKDSINGLVNAHGPQLDRVLTESLSTVERSFLVIWPAQYYNARRNPELKLPSPPVLCPGPDFQPEVKKSLDELKTLYFVLNVGLQDLGMPRLQLALTPQTTKLGQYRFEQVDLETWKSNNLDDKSDWSWLFQDGENK